METREAEFDYELLGQKWHVTAEFQQDTPPNVGFGHPETDPYAGEWHLTDKIEVIPLNGDDEALCVWEEMILWHTWRGFFLDYKSGMVSITALIEEQAREEAGI